MHRFPTIILAVFSLIQNDSSLATPAGIVIGWGRNEGGQAGGFPSYPVSNGVVIVTSNPYVSNTVMVVGRVLTNAIAISASLGYSLALDANGTIIGWGSGLNARSTAEESSPQFISGSNIRILSHSTYLIDSRVAIKGEILSNIVAVASGNYFSMALRNDGSFVSWGMNKVPAGLTDVVDIAAGNANSLALKKDGTIMLWSQIYDAITPFGISNVVAIACGGGSGNRWMTLERNGKIRVWGMGVPPEKPVPEGVTNVVAIASGSYHSLGLRSDGTVIGWGYDGDGQATGVPTNQKADDPHNSVGLVSINGLILSNVVSIAAYGDYSLALKRDGTVVGWGRSCPKVPPGLSGVVAISAGEGYCLAITTNAAVAKHFSQSRITY
jgi:alpha-tubulin suppressor-like RCC1 family protein